MPARLKPWGQVSTIALRWYDVIVPRDAVSALEPFDLEASLRQTAFLFAGKVTTTQAVEVGERTP